MREHIPDKASADAQASDDRTSQWQQQLAAARAELEQFTYTVSHDLRAPLRHINAYAQIIAEDWPDMPTEVAAHLATIRQSAQLLTQQLDGLTLLSRLGQQELRWQAVDMAALAQEVVDELMQPNVQWQLAPDMPRLHADADLLRQVMAHLFGNAVKFSRDRSPAHITLTWQLLGAEENVQPDRCQISLRDNGVGFAPERSQALFKVFGKLHSVRDYDGLGLGLVCSKKIMDRLGGNIGIEAVLNGGCCVTFCLPLALPPSGCKTLTNP